MAGEEDAGAQSAVDQQDFEAALDEDKEEKETPAGSKADSKDEHPSDSGDADESSRATEEPETEQEEEDPLIGQALANGFSEEHARKLSEQGLLESVLTTLDGNLAAIGREALGADDREDDDAGAGEGDASRKSTPLSPSKPLEMKLSEDEFDKSLIGAFERVAQHVNERMAELEARLARHDGDLTERTEQAQRRQEAEFDRLVNDASGRLDGIFGKGSTRTLARNSEARRNRDRLLEEMYALATGYHARGLDVPDNTELMNRALRIAFPRNADAKEQERLETERRKRAGQALGRGTRRTRERQPSGEQKAVDRNKRFWSKHGQPVDEGEADPDVL